MIDKTPDEFNEEFIAKHYWWWEDNNDNYYDDDIKHTQKYIEEECLKCGYICLESYKNALTPFLVHRISCNHKNTMYLSSIRKNGCLTCQINNRYNLNLTDEERKIGRSYPKYRKWVKKTYKQDDFTCQKCKRRGYTLNAHHIYAYAKHSSMRTHPDNGITFCKDCHKNFHHIYGRGNNNFDQLAEFLNY